jgi:alpha-L-rhamnosidase
MGHPRMSRAEIPRPVRFEHRDGGLGIGTGTPRLSWQVVTDDADWSATAYELELTRDGASVPTTVRVESAEQVLVPWPFEPLASRTRASVRVRVASGPQWTGWSEPSLVETGLLEPVDWTARLISPHTLGGIGQPPPVLARTFPVRPGIVSARLYATAHGAY